MDAARNTKKGVTPQQRYQSTAVHCFKAMHARLDSTLSRVAPYLQIYLYREGYWRVHSRTG